MRRTSPLLLTCTAFLLASLLTTPLHALAQLPLTQAPDGTPTLAPMLEEVTPGVVNIATRGRVQIENPLLQDPFFRRFFDMPEFEEREIQNLGSGVVIDSENGYIVTNQHVLEEADQITVTLRDGRQFPATLIGADPEADIAVVQISADNLTAVPLGDSRNLRVGDFVVAIGNPFGLGQTVTSGIVSALGRTGLGIEGFENFIQTDASINPGNSGGALVNLKGELVGINTAILSPAGGNIGIGFAIPINMVNEIMQQLVQYGEVRRGRLGVLIQDLTPDLAKALDITTTQGALVAKVMPGSPAEAAGLQAGDVIVQINGEVVQSASGLRNLVGLRAVGQQIDLVIIRDGKRMTVTATVEEPTQVSLKGEQISSRLRGTTLAVIDESSPLFGRVEGILVVDVSPGSPAWNAGLRKNDIILSINRRRVKSLEELQQAPVPEDEPVLLNVQRDDAALFIAIR